MGATDAERSRRYRRHRRGDHSLCDPSRCGDTAESDQTGVTPVTAPRPTGLASRGRRLWREVDGPNLTGSRRTLAEEACRIADRLEKLDGLLSGDLDAWVRLRMPRGWAAEDADETDLTVTVDRALAEARQQAVALKQIVAELRQGMNPAYGRPAQPGRSGGGIADLTAKIEERRRAAG